MNSNATALISTYRKLQRDQLGKILNNRILTSVCFCFFFDVSQRILRHQKNTKQKTHYQRLRKEQNSINIYKNKNDPYILFMSSVSTPSQKLASANLTSPQVQLHENKGSNFKKMVLKIPSQLINWKKLHNQDNFRVRSHH